MARISKGRSIREFVVGAMIAPAIMCFIWFSFAGGTAIDLTLNGGAGDLIFSVGDGDKIFAMVTYMLGPNLGYLMSVLIVVLLLTYLVTTADSAVLIVNTINAAGDEGPKARPHIYFWGIALGGVVGALLIAGGGGTGGLKAIQTAMVIGAFPFSAVMVLQCISLVKAIWNDVNRRKKGVATTTDKITVAAIDAGTVHVHPEAWLPNLDHQRRKYVLNKKSIKMHPSGGIATQGMCVTKGTAKRTGIKDLSDLSKPEVAKKFDSNGDGKGEVWIGEAGWASIPVEQVRARSYGYDATMRLKIMEESVALAEVDAAVKGKKDIVFFCYTPHHMFAENDLVVLKEPAYDAKKWMIVPPSEVPGWLERSSAPVAWETATINVSYAVSLEKTQPKAAAMLSKVSLSTETLTAMSYALDVEKKDPAAFAAKWVEQNKAVVEGWFE